MNLKKRGCKNSPNRKQPTSQHAQDRTWWILSRRYTRLVSCRPLHYIVAISYYVTLSDAVGDAGVLKMSTQGINNLIPLVWILFSTRLLILISTVSLHETNPEAARCVSVRTYDHMLSHVFTAAPKTPLSQHARSGQISRNVFLGGGGSISGIVLPTINMKE